MKVAFIAAHGHTAARNCAKEVCHNAYYMGVPTWITNPTLRTISLYFRSFIYAFLIPRHNVYLAHSSPGLLCCVIKRKLLRDKGKIIMRANDSMFSNYDLNKTKKKFLRMLYKNVDGVIAISNMIKEDVKKEIDVPVKVVYCQVSDNKYFDIKPDFDKKFIMCLGTAPNDRKGTSIQLDVYNKFVPKKEMYIMGNRKHIYNSQLKNDIEMLNPFYLYLTGITDPREYLNECLFLLHPARFDAGGNAVLEAMASGVIPVVSYMTGNSEIVKQVDKTLIINTFKSDDYYNKLKQLYNLPIDELKILSNKCKEVAKQYSEKNMKNKFKEAFEYVIK